jgi:electron transfer flavoprotein alpha subunit
MPVLIYTETEKGNFKKNAFEVASYGVALAKQLGTSSVAIAFNPTNAAVLNEYGLDQIMVVKQDNLQGFNAKAYAATISEAALQIGAALVVVSSSADSKYASPILAASLKASYAPNVVSLPESMDPFTVKRTAFSNKGFAHTVLLSGVKMIGVANNTFGAHPTEGNAVIENFSPSLDTSIFSTKATSVDKVAGKATIADADVVVSAGRGLKGPENWGMIEELASVLGAATACSKPVSDLGWRPHGEHVGQTGKPVATNLYIAIGISGAIQHLAGVSASKVKVVINTDPEAPFFKAADYGVVGDAFVVVPQLIEKLKVFKAANA